MLELNDSDLLRRYADGNSEEAFAALVARHINKVYSAALRHTRNPSQAEEVTQAVFVILAKKARSLAKGVIVSGWLYQTARLASITFLKSEIRRARREQEAHMQNLLNETANEETWMQIAPLLDAAMAGLNESDRHAVVLRYFDGKSMREVGVALGATEDAAKKRLGRALEKLQRFFAKRGVSSTTAIIAGAISSNSVQAAPPALADAVTAIALAKGATAGGSTLTLIKGALKLMAWTKMKTAVAAGLVVLLAAGTTTVTINKIRENKADDTWRVQFFDSRVLERTSPQVKILPSKLPRGGGCGTVNDKMMGTGVNAETVVQMAYGGASDERTILCTRLPVRKYDFIASLPGGNAKALQREVKKQFGVVASREMIETNVLFLIVEIPDAPGLKPSRKQYGSSEKTTSNQFSCVNQSVHYVAGYLEEILGVPVIDQTGLTQNFDINFKFNRNDPLHKNLKQALLDQLGLELVSTNMPVEMLVVEKAE